MKAQLILKIQSDPESIKLLKNLEEIQKAARILDRDSSQEAVDDVLAVIIDKLNVSTLDEALFAIDMLLQK